MRLVLEHVSSFPALMCTDHVTLDKTCNLSLPRFPHLQNGSNNGTYIVSCVREKSNLTLSSSLHLHSFLALTCLPPHLPICTSESVPTLSILPRNIPQICTWTVGVVKHRHQKQIREKKVYFPYTSPSQSGR